jgi:putative addiction module component (TIGR02574 family)
MRRTLRELGIDRLSVAERLELIGAIWDSLPDSEVPVPESHARVLGERIAAADADPEAAIPWERSRFHRERPQRIVES